MRADLAAHVAAAARAHHMTKVEVRPPFGGAWREVDAGERRGSGEQTFDGFNSRLVTAADEVSFVAADFPDPDERPTTDWLVRFPDGRVRQLTEPARTRDSAGAFLFAPIKAYTGEPPE